MAKAIYHPDRDQIDLSAVLDALSDPVRRQIALRLTDPGPYYCASFCDYGSKTNLTYHLARLREAGVTRVTVEGSRRLITLRTEDLEARFPGLLTAILGNARSVDAPMPSPLPAEAAT